VETDVRTKLARFGGDDVRRCRRNRECGEDGHFRHVAPRNHLHFNYRGLAWFGIEAGQGKPEGTDRVYLDPALRGLRRPQTIDVLRGESGPVGVIRSAFWRIRILMSIKSMEVQSSLNVSRLSMMRKPS